MNKDTAKTILRWTYSLALALATCLYGYWLGKKRTTGTSPAVYVTRCDTVRHVDTVMIRDVKIKERTLLRADTIKTLTLEHDTVEVEVPISQSVYQDSIYTAWVSGYRASLDSIQIRPVSYVVTRESVVTGKRKRWRLGVSVGCGATPKGVQPFIGVGVGYNIVEF
jgi:hypothetical protein